MKIRILFVLVTPMVCMMTLTACNFDSNNPKPSRQSISHKSESMLVAGEPYLTYPVPGQMLDKKSRVTVKYLSPSPDLPVIILELYISGSPVMYWRLSVPKHVGENTFYYDFGARFTGTIAIKVSTSSTYQMTNELNVVNGIIQGGFVE